MIWSRFSSDRAGHLVVGVVDHGPDELFAGVVDLGDRDRGEVVDLLSVNTELKREGGPGERRQRGYQINIGRAAAEEYVGLHYKEWLDKGDEKDEFRKPLKWNTLRIRAVGPHIQAWLNGHKIVDYTDPDPAPEHLAPGTIAFQTYGAEGHAGWVKFRNLILTEISD